MNDTPETTDEQIPTPRMEHAGPQVSITDEMKTSFLDYAMSVIISRAIPDLREMVLNLFIDVFYMLCTRQETPTTNLTENRHDQLVT